MFLYFAVILVVGFNFLFRFFGEGRVCFCFYFDVSFESFFFLNLQYWGNGAVFFLSTYLFYILYFIFYFYFLIPPTHIPSPLPFLFLEYIMKFSCVSSV